MNQAKRIRNLLALVGLLCAGPLLAKPTGDQVNEAIEFFPGRVKRDEWANQAKELLEQTAKGDA